MSLIGIWQIRNRVETGYSGFSTVFDKSLYYAQAASVLAKLEGKSDFRELWNLMDRKVNEHSARFRERFEYMRQEGTRLTLAHPWTYAKIHIRGIMRTLSGAEAHTYIRLLKLFHGTEDDWQELITGDLLDTIRHNSNNLTHAAILTIAWSGTDRDAGLLICFCRIIFQKIAVYHACGLLFMGSGLLVGNNRGPAWLWQIQTCRYAYHLCVRRIWFALNSQSIQTYEP